MFKFTKARIAYIFLISIFIILEIFIIKNKIRTNIKPVNIMGDFGEKIKAIQDVKSDQTEIQQDKANTKEKQTKVEKWQLEIPAINLNAVISEGTSQQTLNQYIGHFEKTQKENGNIGLAAHNRGYKVNYFQNLKQLKTGDEIRYSYNGLEKIYEVEKHRIIKDTDWEYLENTEDNRLTLITCVENQPEYRRCIQAIEKEEE